MEADNDGTATLETFPRRLSHGGSSIPPAALLPVKAQVKRSFRLFCFEGLCRRCCFVVCMSVCVRVCVYVFVFLCKRFAALQGCV